MPPYCLALTIALVAALGVATPGFSFSRDSRFLAWVIYRDQDPAPGRRSAGAAVAPGDGASKEQRLELQKHLEERAP